MQDLPPLLRADDLAPLLGISPHGVRAWIRRGLLPASKPGRFYIIRREVLMAFLERGERARRAPTPQQQEPARLLRGLPPPRRRGAEGRPARQQHPLSRDATIRP